MSEPFHLNHTILWTVFLNMFPRVGQGNWGGFSEELLVVAKIRGGAYRVTLLIFGT
jgi:hypothetical protein